MQKLLPDELSEQLQDEDTNPLVLDIRHRAEFEAWHIPGSRNVDVYDERVNDPEQAKSALSALPRDQQVGTVCAAGIVSQTAAE